MLETEIGSIYTGITNNLARRIQQHLDGDGAKYTKSHGVVKILGARPFNSRSNAMKEEYRIKNELSHSEKREMSLHWNTNNLLDAIPELIEFTDFLKNSLDSEQFHYFMAIYGYLKK